MQPATGFRVKMSNPRIPVPPRPVKLARLIPPPEETPAPPVNPRLAEFAARVREAADAARAKSEQIAQEAALASQGPRE